MVKYYITGGVFMNKWLKSVVFVGIGGLLFFTVNYLFFHSEGQIRTSITQENIVQKNDTYYLVVDDASYEIDEQFQKRIDTTDTIEYDIDYTYNSLFQRGKIVELHKIGTNYNK